MNAERRPQEEAANEEPMQRPGPQDTPGWCHTDEFGQIDTRCWAEIQTAEGRAYARGYAAGRADLIAESWELARQVVRGAAASVDVLTARRRADERRAKAVSSR